MKMVTDEEWKAAATRRIEREDMSHGEPTAHLYGAPSVMHDIANHDLQLIWYTEGRPVAEARIPIEDVLDFIRKVTSEGVNAVDGAVSALQMGDCATCQNTRLVDVELRGGRKSNEYCPDCNKGGKWGAFKDVPTVGPKRREGF